VLAAFTIHNRRLPVEPEVPAFHCAVEGPPPCATATDEDLRAQPAGERNR
jgi:hypothetical protein